MLVVARVIPKGMRFPKISENEGVLDGIVRLLSVFNSGQNGFPLDHNNGEIVAPQFHVQEEVSQAGLCEQNLPI